MTTFTASFATRKSGTVEPALPNKRTRARAGRILVAAVAVVGVVGIGAQGYDRYGPSAAPAPTADVTSAARAVTVTRPAVSDVGAELTLPAQALPNQQATLYPRVDGYVARWHADRGAPVSAGQLLAEIDTPELDQQARQSAAALDRGRATVVQFRADREQAAAEADAVTAQVRVVEADAVLADQELERVTSTIRAGGASRTDYDTAVRNRDAAAARVTAAKADASAKVKLVASRDAAVATQEANVGALDADLARLKELQQFKRIVAPFAGTVTRRQAEVGMLVTAGSGSPLFHLQDSSVLRVQVDVPQRYAAAARRATAAQVLVPESPDRPLTAAVARTANALDPATRTLRVELDLPNPDRAVLAGTFTRVRLRVPGERPALTVPVGTLRYTPDGTQVAVVAGDVVELRAVTLGRDYGRSVEIATGLSGAERLVINPPDDLRAGEPVRVVGERPADGQAAALVNTWPAGRDHTGAPTN